MTENTKPVLAVSIARSTAVKFGAGAILAALALVAILVLTGGDGGAKLTTDFISRMAARDARVVDLIDQPLLDVASQMGIAGLPASASLSAEDVKVESKKIGETVVVTATYTLSASAPGGLIAQSDQALSASVIKTSTGYLLTNLSIGPALVFDAAAYFPRSESGEGAQTIAADLRAGNAWIPGVFVAVTPTESTLTLPDELVDDEDHLTSYSVTERPAVPGVETTWTVTVTVDDTPMSELVAGSAVTEDPVAARIRVGTIQDDGVYASAVVVARDFVAAIAAGQQLDAMLTSGSPTLAQSGLDVMKQQLPRVGEAGEYLIVQEDPLTVGIGDLALVRHNGAWLVDGKQSTLVTAFLAGSGKHGYNSGPGWLDFSGCETEAKIRLSFLGIAFDSATDSAQAQFKVASTGDVKCDHGASFDDVSATWPGNRDGSSLDIIGGSEPGQTVVRSIQLPAAFGAKDLPLTITVGRVSSLDVGWTFQVAK